MPWIDENVCIGCTVCAEKCPVGAISITGATAKIDMARCIRCGTCHSVCPQNAIKHDNEKIPDEIWANIKLTKHNMVACARYFNDEKEKIKCLDKMRKFFNKEKVVAEKTLAELEKINIHEIDIYPQ
jgi:Fe-S-cluster-containing hydrogenase component 2